LIAREAAFAIVLFSALTLCAGEVTYRTDGGNEKLPWFQLKAGEFPPEGSAHYISGELIGVDHINRAGVLRPDRNDSQRTDDYDKASPFTLLPYGSITYHGAPAEMRDIPIGTHLHGQFYIEEKVDKNGKGAFNRCLKLEDDFSFFQRQQRAWRVESVQLDKNKLNVIGVGPGDKVDAKPTAFVINAATRIWKGRAIGTLADVAAGQRVLINLTVCTLKGPGRCTDIWIDEESQKVATAQQVEIHRLFQREHGLACWIDEVDNKESIVTVTLFGGFDPKLKEDFPLKMSVAAAVAEENLRTYDQINDTMRGPILEILEVPVLPGSSGIRLKFKVNTLLEGYRPKRFLRLFSGKWKVDDIPKEERLYPF